MPAENRNAHEIGNKLIEVDFAREFKDSIVKSNLLEFTTMELRNKILNSADDQLIVVTSTINSPKKVEAVEFYNEEFLERTL